MEKQIIRQLYHNALKEEAGGTEKVSKETKAAIDAILEVSRNDPDQGFEKHRDELFLAASAAEENGFAKGFAYAFRLLCECR